MEKTDIRRNSINTLRLIAALQVFVGHAIPEMHVDLPVFIQPFMKIINLFEGVPTFFIISGFLMWNSIKYTPNFKVYLKKRIFRIYPELWGGVLLNAVLMIVFYGSQIVWKDFVLFQFTQSTIFQFYTPESLKGYATGHPNGPLWTISVMVQCYVVLWFMYKFLHNKKLRYWILTMILTISFCIVKPVLFENIIPTTIYRLIWYTFANQIWLFLLGAILCEYLDEIIVSLKKYWWICFGLLAFVVYTKCDINIGYGLFKSIFLSLTIVGITYRFPKINIKYDFTYGIYIYHMIVINAMCFLGYIGKFKYMIIALFISVILAIISYFTFGKISRSSRRVILKN